ncbi:MAG: RNA methyltransferase [Flavobacteriaceae bacterium]|nr:RNA methyltransferase [Flavobacteriaceae bacterium]
MHKQITSTQNPLIKEIIQLQEKSRVRKKKELFIIEGYREINLALKGGFQLKSILFCEEIISKNKVDFLIETSKQNIEILEVSLNVYQKIAHRKTTEGIIAITIFKELGLNDLKLKNNPLILIAEAPEKPGNLGALLRTADAANLDAVIIANAKTDLFNPNIIRSSVGCVFTKQIATGTTEEIIAFLHKNNIEIYAAALSNESEIYTAINYKNSSAIVVGTEATGLSDTWLKNASKNIIIPMQGEIDSLNVSVSAAIIIFEAKRQRNYN